MSKLKLATIIGTRPEIIRLSVLIKKADEILNHILIHTGQNYDYELNEIFTDELGIRKPDYFLGVATGNLGDTIGNIIARSYEVLNSEKPDALLVLGDTNSVLSIIAAKRLKIPVFHMEAGNRCFDEHVPEEINRRIADHTSDINLAYTENSRRYLLSEGFRKDHIFVTGSPLREVLDVYEKQIDENTILERLNLKVGSYIVVSTHREDHIDETIHFNELVRAINKVAEIYNFPIIFSTHPRTRKKINETGAVFHSLVTCMSPLGFFDYVKLQKNAYIVLSDSGSLSEEAAIAGFCAVSIRTSTERPEAIDAGTILLGGITTNEILQAIKVTKATSLPGTAEIPNDYQVRNTSDRVLKIIQGFTAIINRRIWGKEAYKD